MTWTGAATPGSSCTASGAGDIHDTIDLLAGGTVTYTATGTLDAAATGTPTNRASVALPAGYEDPVPENNAAFREFTLKWWGKEPSPKGYTTQRNHAARWGSYDEKESARVRKRVQDIMDRYFPEGRPVDHATGAQR